MTCQILSCFFFDLKSLLPCGDETIQVIAEVIVRFELFHGELDLGHFCKVEVCRLVTELLPCNNVTEVDPELNLVLEVMEDEEEESVLVVCHQLNNRLVRRCFEFLSTTVLAKGEQQVEVIEHRTTHELRAKISKRLELFWDFNDECTM